MDTRNALRAAFTLPESRDNLTRTIAALPKSRPIPSEGMLNAHFQLIRIVHIANISLVWPVNIIRPVGVFFEERHTVRIVLLHDVIDACHVHNCKTRDFLDQFHDYPITD